MSLPSPGVISCAKVGRGGVSLQKKYFIGSQNSFPESNQAMSETGIDGRGNFTFGHD
jgi:hypothetical protein